MAKKKSRHQRRAASMLRMGSEIDELRETIQKIDSMNYALVDENSRLQEERDTLAVLALIAAVNGEVLKAERDVAAMITDLALTDLEKLTEVIESYSGVIAAYNRAWEEAERENQLRSAAEVRNWTFGEEWFIVADAWKQQQLFHVKATQDPKIERSSWPSGDSTVQATEFTTSGELSTQFTGIGRVVVPCTITHYVSVRPDEVSFSNMIIFSISVGNKNLTFRIRSGGLLFYSEGQLFLEHGDTFILRDEEGNSAGDSSHFATVYNFRPMHPKSPSDW